MVLVSGNNKATKGFSSFAGFGDSSTDLSTSEGLLALAKQRGGAVGQVAEELAHPERGILSTMGNGFKEAFKGFVDVISMPSQIVAGTISSKITVGEAIDKNISPSDVIFGEKNPDATTMQKVGGFVVRTATDILLDPLTYVSFGASKGIFGLSSLPKITLGEKAVAQAGIKGSEKIISKAVSKEGFNVIKYLKGTEKQAKGLISAEKVLKLKGEGAIYDLAKEELDLLLKETIDSKFSMDFAKKAVSNMLEKQPQLVGTILDKGGIKFAGRTILTGQKIAKAVDLIPGMSILDHYTSPIRNVLGNMFDPAVIKNIEGEYIRLPEELVGLKSQLKTMVEANQIQSVQQVLDIVRVNKLTPNEIDTLANALSTRMIPNDARGAKFYKEALGINDKTFADMKSAGIPITYQDNRIGLLFNGDKIKSPSFSSQLKSKVGVAQEAKHAKFISQKGEELGTKIPEFINELKDVGMPQEGIKHISSLKSTYEAQDTVSHFISDHLNTLETTGKTFEEAMSDPSTQKLFSIREKIKQFGLAEPAPLVGKPMDYGLTAKLTKEEAQHIIENATRNIEKLNINKEALTSDIEKLLVLAQETAFGKISDKAEEIFKTLNIRDKGTIKELLNNLRVQVGEFNIKTLTAKQAKETFVEGVKTKKAISEMSQEAVDRLKGKLRESKMGLGKDISKLNKFLDEYKPIKPVVKDIKKTSAKTINDQVSNVLEQFKLETAVSKAKTIENKLDTESFAKFVAVLKNEFETNPTGIKNILNQIIGKEQKITDVIANIDLEQLALKQNLSDLPNLDRFFVDPSGEIFKRVATHGKELADAGYDGFDTNLLSVMVQNQIRAQEDIFSRHFMSEIARSYGRLASEAPEGFIPIGSKGISQEAVKYAKETLGVTGEEFVYHPSVVALAEDMIKGAFKGDTSEVWKKFDKLQQYWKASVTSVFPAFHGRNAISNVFLNFMDLGIHVLNPRTNLMTADIMNKDWQANRLQFLSMGVGDEAKLAKEKLKDLLSKVIFTDGLGHDWTFGKLRQVIKERGIALNPNITGQLDIRSTKEELVSKLGEIQGLQTTKQKVISTAKKVLPLNATDFIPFKGGQMVARNIEGYSRILNFTSNLIKTGDVSHAASRTKQFLFDYNNLTNFEKTFMKRIIPFYTFTRKNIELQVKSLMTMPGRTSAQITLLNNLGDLFAGASLTEEQKDALPDWIKAGINILKSKKGSAVEIYQSLGTPLEQPFLALQMNQILGSISPLIRVPVEQMSGYSFFKGKMLSDVTNASAYKSAPKAIKDLIGYTEVQATTKEGKKFTMYVSLRPKMMNLINNLPPSGRVLTSLRQMQAEDVSGQSKILQLLLGVKAFSFDLEQEEAKRERELKTKLEKLLSDAKITAQFKRTFIPNSQKKGFKGF